MTTAEKRLLVRDLARHLFAVQTDAELHVRRRLYAAFLRRLRRMQRSYPDLLLDVQSLHRDARRLIAAGRIWGPGKDW